MMTGSKSGGFLKLAQPKSLPAGYLEIFQRKCAARSFFYDSGEWLARFESHESMNDGCARWGHRLDHPARRVPKLTCVRLIDRAQPYGQKALTARFSQLNARIPIFFGTLLRLSADRGYGSSRTLSRTPGVNCLLRRSRNVNAPISGLQAAVLAHALAGRIPPMRLRLFLSMALLEIGNLTEDETVCSMKRNAQPIGRQPAVNPLEASRGSLGPEQYAAGLVVAPTMDSPLRHIEFVSLAPVLRPCVLD